MNATSSTCTELEIALNNGKHDEAHLQSAIDKQISRRTQIDSLRASLDELKAENTQLEAYTLALRSELAKRPASGPARASQGMAAPVGGCPLPTTVGGKSFTAPRSSPTAATSTCSSTGMRTANPASLRPVAASGVSGYRPVPIQVKPVISGSSATTAPVARPAFLPRF